MVSEDVVKPGSSTLVMPEFGAEDEPWLEVPESNGERVVSSSEFIHKLLHELTLAIGPAAKIVVSDHIAALGESYDDFPAARRHELVTSVRAEILHPAMRQEFESRMAEYLRSFIGRPQAVV
jgi:hypothetical protein